jgi:hypothetical protein
MQNPSLGFGALISHRVIQRSASTRPAQMPSKLDFFDHAALADALIKMSLKREKIRKGLPIFSKIFTYIFSTLLFLWIGLFCRVIALQPDNP